MNDDNTHESKAAAGAPLAGSTDSANDRDRIKHVTAESGHDPRLFSWTFAAPLKLYVGDTLVYDSEANSPNDGDMPQNPAR